MKFRAWQALWGFVFERLWSCLCGCACRRISTLIMKIVYSFLLKGHGGAVLAAMPLSLRIGRACGSACVDDRMLLFFHSIFAPSVHGADGFRSPSRVRILWRFSLWRYVTPLLYMPTVLAICDGFTVYVCDGFTVYADFDSFLPDFGLIVFWASIIYRFSLWKINIYTSDNFWAIFLWSFWNLWVGGFSIYYAETAFVEFWCSWI